MTMSSYPVLKQKKQQDPDHRRWSDYCRGMSA